MRFCPSEKRWNAIGGQRIEMCDLVGAKLAIASNETDIFGHNRRFPNFLSAPHFVALLKHSVASKPPTSDFFWLRHFATVLGHCATSGLLLKCPPYAQVYYTDLHIASRKYLPAVFGPRDVLILVTRGFVWIEGVTIANEFRPIHRRAPRVWVQVNSIGYCAMTASPSTPALFNNVRRGLIYGSIPLVIGMSELAFAHFAYAIIVGGLNLGETCTHFADFWLVNANQAFLLIWHGILPYALLALVLFSFGAASYSRRRLICLLGGGVNGAICAVIPFDHFVWYTHFNGDDPALVGPLIWLILPGVGMGGSVVGLCVGWVVSKVVQ
jgi:hypothetical protein